MRHCECLESAAGNSMKITSPFQLQPGHLDVSKADFCYAKILERPAGGGSQQMKATCLRDHCVSGGWAAISLVCHETQEVTAKFSKEAVNLDQS